MVDHWENSNSTLAEQWASVRGQLRAEVGDAAFNSWLKPLTLGEILCQPRTKWWKYLRIPY